MSAFNPKQLRMLSPDADDWTSKILDLNFPNQEASVYGVLLYPRKGISKNRLIDEVTCFIESEYSFGQGCLEVIIKRRGEDWAVTYQVTSWYNHFNLKEEYD